MKTKTALLAAFLLTACAIGRAEVFEQILVKVNGEIFTKSDLEQRQIGVLRQKGQQIDLKSATGDAQLRKALDEITPQLMVDVVDEMLLLQRGKELGYRIGDDQFKSIVDNIKKENKIETEEQFQAALKSENMTLADLRRNLEKTVIIQRVQQNEVMGKIGVTEDEARSYYDAHLSEFTSAPSVTLREILVSVPTDPKGVNAAADEAAQAKAAELRKRVTTGGDSFEKLASEVSESPSKANSGLIGPLNLGDISPDHDPREALLHYVRLKVRLSKERPHASRVFAAEVLSGAPVIGRFLRTDLKRWVDRQAAVFRQWSRQGRMEPIEPRHLFFLIWAMTQTYADFEVQVQAVLGRRTLREADYARAERTIGALVLRGCGLVPRGPRRPNKS